MADQNLLEDTSDSILPIKNALGLSAEVFNEILREFDRACKTKKIEKAVLINYMGNRSSWKIKCVAIGAVSNVLINMGNDSDEQLGILNSIGEDMVVDEIIKAIINETGNRSNDSRNTNGKKSTSKIPQAPSSSSIRRREPQGNTPNPIEYHKPKSSNNSVMLVLFSLVGVILVLGGFILYKSTGSKPDNQQNLPAPIVKNEPPIETPKQVPNEPIQKPVEIKRESSMSLPYTGPIVAKEGIIIYQSGQDNFIGGEIATVSSNKKKKNTSPFTVGNRDGTSYSLLKIDLRNIPKDATIENATLRLNVISNGGGTEQVQLYCLPANSSWTFNNIFYNPAGGNNEISYENLVKNKNSPLAQKVVVTLRNDWVSFNITSLVQDWISNKAINNGVVIFTESDSEISFDGFDSYKKMISPKLAISFGVPPKKVEVATDANLIKPADPHQNKNETPEEPNKSTNSNNLKSDKEDVENKTNKPKENEIDSVIKNLDNPEKEEEKAKNDKTEKNIFEEELDLKKKENNNPAEPKKANIAAGIVEKQPEKIEPIKPDFGIDVTMKAPNVLPKARLIEATELIKIENLESQGEIRYTIDGKDPTPDSLIYIEPVKLSGVNLQNIKSAIFLGKIRKSPVTEKEYRLIGKNGQLIDNNMSSCKKTGDWEINKAKPGYYGKDYLWAQKGKGTVEWIPSFNKKTNCEVYIWIPDGDALTRSKQAIITIKFDGGIKDVPLDQTTRGNSWIYLGAYPMKAGSGSVTLTNDNSGKIFVADAVYFLFLPDGASIEN
jgi:hypothetical protein